VHNADNGKNDDEAEIDENAAKTKRADAVCIFELVRLYRLNLPPRQCSHQRLYKHLPHFNIQERQREEVRKHGF
jgi:hypothetical protein